MGHLRRFRRQMGATSQGAKSGPAEPGNPECVELDQSELEAILEHSKAGPLNQAEYETLHVALETLIFRNRSRVFWGY